MIIRPAPSRRQALTLFGSSAATLVAGCDRVNAFPPMQDVLALGRVVTMRAQRLVTAPTALAPTFTPSELSPVFRTNGNTSPASAEYQQHAREGFRNWRLKVDGEVRRPLALSLDQIRSMPARTQITQHDCVEGWSAIGEWTGVRLGMLLDLAGMSPAAKYVVFHCADDFDGVPYYESVDLIGAYHPQTILAWGMNGRMLPVPHGAPVRLRLERQLGYKQAKYVMRVEAVRELAGIGKGGGGYWEDADNYQWYAGI